MPTVVTRITFRDFQLQRAGCMFPDGLSGVQTPSKTPGPNMQNEHHLKNTINDTAARLHSHHFRSRHHSLGAMHSSIPTAPPARKASPNAHKWVRKACSYDGVKCWTFLPSSCSHLASSPRWTEVSLRPGSLSSLYTRSLSSKIEEGNTNRPSPAVWSN